MDSPLARVILATISGYILILLFISVYDWVLENYPSRPTEPMNSERIQHPLHHQEAITALQLFSQLPKAEKKYIRESLNSNLISMNKWLSHLEQSGFQVLCLGELHKESTRSFLSKNFFTNLNFDVLMLEVTPKKLKLLINRMEAGRDYFPLLGADILDTLRAVEDRNQTIKIYGIEETDEQAKHYHVHPNSRDRSIAQNFWDTFEPGMRHIILFGALHCANESNWLFQNLCSQASSKLKNEMRNVLILGEHQNGPVEAFVYFIDEIGLDKKNFVIPDTNSFPNHIYKWFTLLNRQILLKYQSVIVFRT